MDLKREEPTDNIKFEMFRSNIIYVGPRPKRQQKEE